MNSKQIAIFLRLVLGLSLLSGLLAGNTSPVFAAGPVYVDADATGGANNGSSWADAYTSLQTALAATSSGEIWVAEGTYAPGDLRADTFGLKNGVAIYGGFAGTESQLSERDPAAHVTILSGDIGAAGDPADNSYHVVTGSLTDSTAVLDGFTITRGNADAGSPPDSGGGGLYILSGDPSLANLIFDGNHAVYGAGILSDHSSPSLANVKFLNGTAAGGGGGMYNAASSPTLLDVTFSNNSVPAPGGGGGLYNDGGSDPLLTNVTFSGNSAEAGGGIVNVASSPELINVTFSGNTGSQYGGGMSNWNGSGPSLAHVTFSGNASPHGAAVYNTDSGATVIRNSILYGDTSAEIEDTSGTLLITYSIIQGGHAGAGNLGADPLLGPLQDNGGLTQTRALSSGSPAIDAAADTACSSADQRGLARPQGLHCDMGAYEYAFRWYVKSDAGGADNGSTWVNAFNSLQGALAAAGPGDQIWVAAGTYVPGALRSDTFSLKNGVAVYGGFAGTESLLSARDPAVHVTILSGDIGTAGDPADNSFHVVMGSLTDSTAVLDGFTVTAGNADGASYPLYLGGGMFNENGSPTLRNLIFSANKARAGGGMYNLSSGPVLTNVTFTGNTAANSGGGMTNFSSSPTLDQVTFSANSAGSYGGGMENSQGSAASLAHVTFDLNTAGKAGGGLYNSQSSPVLANVTFTANSAAEDAGGSGGGMFNGSSSPALTGVTFSGNHAATGGGIANRWSSPSLTRVVFSGNSAVLYGGGMSSYAGSPALLDVTFDANDASYGGGMSNSSSTPGLTDVTFSGNTADNAGSSQGGGMYSTRSTPSLTNVTFSGNLASASGGAMRNLNGSHAQLAQVTFSGNSAGQGGAIHNGDSSPVITNSIFYGDGGGEILNSGSSMPVVTYSLVQGGYPGAGNLDANPLLGALLPNGGFTKTRALAYGSPAIDSGTAVGCPPTDQRGVSRPRGAGCDMGAYEYDRILYVKADAGGKNDGSSWDNAFSSLQPALAAALQGRQIWVAAGTYTPGASRDDTFSLKTNVALYGGFNGSETARTQRNPSANPTILSGDIGTQGLASDNSYHVVTAINVNAGAVLDGFTIRDGNASAANPNDRGAGMYIFGANPKVNNVLFTANHALASGAGMYILNSKPALTDVTLSANQSPAGAGAGIYNSLSNTTLLRVTFMGNTAGLGGGMYNDASDPAMTAVTFSGNSATDGGGLYNFGSNPILKNSTFNANQAGHAGGALYNLLSGPILTNLTFNANSATGLDSMGGAIFDDASTLTLRNVTLSGNSASAGGALYHGSGSAGQVDNSILWADGASEAVIDSSVQPSTLLIYDSLAAGGCPAGALCSHVLNADPLLGPLANNGGTTQTMALGAGSAAIDSGSSAACPPTDQRGVKRPQGPQCDMGAYEMSSVTASLLSAGALDGWVLESTETSSLGGTLDSTAATFLLGDDAANRQYRAILSFDTSGIPPTAVITSATLKIKRAGLVGTDPFTTHQYILADMRSGFFSTLEALQTKDFSAASSRPSAFSILNTPVNGWYSAPLAPTRFMYINRSGLTQIRLRFRLDDDNDLSADYLKFYSGDIGVSSARPRLVITYYVPQ